MLYMDHKFNPGRTSRSPDDDVHRRMHFDIHRAVNLTSISCVLAKMKEQGTPEQTLKQFRAMADALVGLMTTENNRNHGF